MVSLINTKSHLSFQLSVEPWIPSLPNGNPRRHWQQSHLFAVSAREGYKEHSDNPHQQSKGVWESGRVWQRKVAGALTYGCMRYVTAAWGGSLVSVLNHMQM